jgi:ElaB/YqjD/DUF883 family membrane-anchored ribosome-binding protein
VTDVAHELARRVRPAYLKTRVKGAVKEKAVDVKERTLGSPWPYAVAGGLATAGIAKWILARREQRVEPSAESYGYGGITAEEHLPEGETGPGRMETLKEDLKAKAEHIKDKLPSGAELRQKAQVARERATDFAEEQPLVVALGAIALGAAVGFLLPVSRKERELIAPVKTQAGQRLQGVMDDVRQRVET